MLLGTDRALFETGSPVRSRLTKLGSLYTEGLDSIVLSTGHHGVTHEHELAPQVHAYPTNSRSRLLYGWDAIRIAKKLARPDIISAQDPFETGLAAFFIARYFRVPFVVEIHTDFLSPDFARHSLLNRARVLIARFVLKHAQGGYAVSASVRDRLVKRYGLSTSFAVLPIFIDLTRYARLSRTPVHGELLWIGRLTREKNPQLALEALARVRKAGQEVHLTILGEGPLMANLRVRAHELGISSVVQFAGWQDPAPYLSNAELLLVTSDYEGYGMALVEALAAGVPVVSTDVGVAREAGARIVSGDYGDELLAWLQGPRNPGVLQLNGYTTEEEYLTRVAEFYASHL